MLPLISAARNRILEVGRWSVLLCLFSVPINKPATNIFIFVALLCALCGARACERFHSAWRQPIVIGAAIWFALLFVSTLRAPTGSGPWSALSSYVALLYPLIVASLLETAQWRRRGLFAFALAASLILVISWAQFAGIAPLLNGAGKSLAYRYTVFKDYTQQGVTFTVLAAMAASFANTETDRRRKRLLWVLACAAFINVIFLLQSRTAYLIAIPLLLYWVWRLAGGRRAGWRAPAAGLVALLLMGSAASLAPSVQQRFEQSQHDIAGYAARQEATSMGIRLELWKRTLPIIASAPIFGHGMGQWAVEYDNQTKGLPDFALFKMGHPHQEALFILAEQGFVGLMLFTFLLIGLAKYIKRLNPPAQDFYICLLLIYLTAGLANCLLLDFSHRHLFLMLLACIPVVPSTEPPQSNSAAA